MKNLLIFFLLSFIVLTVSGNAMFSGRETVSGNAVADEENPDSMVNITAYFCKNDTFVYWINSSNFTIEKHDTTKTFGVTMKVMLTVRDSTKKKYNMAYKFLEFESDTLADSTRLAFQQRLVSLIGSRLVGTEIRFRTDEFGHITDYENLGELKKQAKQLYAEVIGGLFNVDASKGFKPEKFMRHTDADELIKGYTEELEALFMLHGKAFTLGEYEDHIPESDHEYASDTYNYASVDSTKGECEVIVEIRSYIPPSGIKAMLEGLMENLSGEKLPEQGAKAIDSLKEPLVSSEYYRLVFDGYSGWPLAVLREKSTGYEKMGRGKYSRTSIIWSSYSTCDD